MKLKKGVWLPGLKMEMRKVFVNAEAIWIAHSQELVVTSGLDGTHSAGSLHYYGYALDLRTSYFSHPEAMAVSRTLRVALGSDYDVVLHPHRYHDSGVMKSPGHIHVEYDPAD